MKKMLQEEFYKLFFDKETFVSKWGSSKKNKNKIKKILHLMNWMILNVFVKLKKAFLSTVSMQKYRIKLCIINKLKEKKNDAVFKNIFLRGLETSGINAKNKRMLMA